MELINIYNNTFPPVLLFASSALTSFSSLTSCFTWACSPTARLFTTCTSTFESGVCLQSVPATLNEYTQRESVDVVLCPSHVCRRDRRRTQQAIDVAIVSCLHQHPNVSQHTFVPNSTYWAWRRLLAQARSVLRCRRWSQLWASPWRGCWLHGGCIRTSDYRIVFCYCIYRVRDYCWGYNAV